MPVFDFSNPESTTTTTEVTYTTFHSDKNVATPEDPILLLDNAPLPVGSSFLRCIHKSCKAHSI